MILLPSTASCNMYSGQSPQKPQRPKLRSFGIYEALSAPSTTSPTGLLASCRTLQSILGGGLQTDIPPPPQSIEPNPDTPQLSYSFTTPLSQELPTPPQTSFHIPIQSAATNGAKRRRDEDELELDDDILPFEDTDAMDLDQNTYAYEHAHAYQTPKRQCRIPLNLPRGLGPSDFTTSPQQPQPMDEQMDEDPDGHLTGPLAPHTGPELGILDFAAGPWDRRSWQFGQDRSRTSLTERWKTLIGRDDMTDPMMRRTGELERTGLHVGSW